MKTEFIPYEQALALKELGFDDVCLGAFNNQKAFETVDVNQFHEDFNESSIDFECKNSWYSKNGECISAPLYQQAFRWFRKKYNLFFNIYSSDPSRTDVYWNIFIFGKTKNRHDVKFEYVSMIYEEVELDCLKKLIEICCKLK